jgi:hypothetical protein
MALVASTHPPRRWPSARSRCGSATEGWRTTRALTGGVGGGRRAGRHHAAQLADHGARHHLRQDRDLAAVGLCHRLFPLPFRMLFFWLIFITLMLPVEVRILPTYEVVASAWPAQQLYRPDHPADRLGHGDLPVPAVLPDHPGRADGGRAHRPGGADPLLLRHPAAAVAHQHRGALHHPLHLWLEPVSLAAPDHHRHLPDTIVMGIQRMVNRRRPADLAPDHGHRDPGDDAAGAGGARHAETLREGPGGKREIMAMAETLSNVGKTYPGGVTAVTRRRRHRGRRVHRARRPLGLRQVHDPAHDRGAGGDHRRRHPIGGRVVNKLEPGERDIAMVFQNYALYPHMRCARTWPTA